MENYIIKETTVWGDHYRARTPTGVLRCIQKGKILQAYPIVDHHKVYVFKPSNQRGPARESQTFIVSYAYVYDEFIGDKETELVNTLTSINLRFYKEPCVFRGKNAYKILIMDTDVDLDTVLGLIPEPV
jgi:hypothetical protein